MRTRVDGCDVSPQKNCCRASFSPRTWTGPPPPPVSMTTGGGWGSGGVGGGPAGAKQGFQSIM